MSISQNYPNVKPELLIDLQNVGKLDPRLTFARASVGTYYDANGVLQTAPSGVARFQFDPVTGASQGLLRENQATNLFPWSEVVNSGFPSNTSAAMLRESDVAIAPDGTLTADKIIQTGVGAPGVLKNFITVVTGAVYTISIYAKAAGWNRIGIRAGQSALNHRATINLIDGSIIGGTAGTAIVTNVGNGWWRIAISGAVTGTNYQISVEPHNTGVVQASETPDGTSGIYIWGAQLEANSYPTSYIKTEASQVTRAADTVTLTNTDAYNTSEFTAVSQPFGVSGVSANTVTLNGDVPIERLYVYSRNLPQDQINTLVENDGWWSWRIVGSDFALPSFTTDGTVIVDWGDGTVETLTTAVHTFTNASPHTVRFKMGSGTEFTPRIIGNVTHKDKVFAVGSVPSNMNVNLLDAFSLCSNLKSIDSTFKASANISNAFRSCTALTAFPFIDTSSVTTAGGTFGPWQSCSSLQSFPKLDLSSATTVFRSWYFCTSLTEFPAIDFPVCTNFTEAWRSCSSLTSFPLIDTSSGTNFTEAWRDCSGLTNFPLIDTSLNTSFVRTWINCSNLTAFPLINTSSGLNYESTWQGCSSLTSFPLININVSNNFRSAWSGCSSLTDFPANFFDSWAGVPIANCFLNTWLTTSALTTTSVENILVSIDTSGVSAPATGTEITISYNVATGALTTPTTDAITSLKGKNWTIKINGVLQ